MLSFLHLGAADYKEKVNQHWRPTKKSLFGTDYFIHLAWFWFSAFFSSIKCDYPKYLKFLCNVYSFSDLKTFFFKFHAILLLELNSSFLPHFSSQLIWLSVLRDKYCYSTHILYVDFCNFFVGHIFILKFNFMSVINMIFFKKM